MTPLGAEIRAMRAARKVTLKQHSERVGVTPAYLSALEHGHRGLPTPPMLDRIATALDLGQAERHRLELLLDLSKPKVTIDTSGLVPVATEVANRLAHSISQMSDAELQTLRDFLQRPGSGSLLRTGFVA